jgi:hypothetical protein
MGALSRIRCELCAEPQQVTFEGFAGAVVIGGESTGKIVTEHYLVYLRGNDDLVELPHPIEERSLREAGGAWTTAAREGRILCFTNLLCEDCGANSKTAEISTGALGCTTGLAAGFVAAAANYWLIDLHWLTELGFVYVAMFAPTLACGWYFARRHAERAAPFRFSRCHECGSTRGVSLSAAQKKRFPCRQCGERSVLVTFAGRS